MEKERRSGNRIRLVQHHAVGRLRHSSSGSDGQIGTDAALAYAATRTTSTPPHRSRTVVARSLARDDLNVPLPRRAVAEIAQHRFHAATHRRIELRGVQDGGWHVNSQGSGLKSKGSSVKPKGCSRADLSGPPDAT